MENVDLSVLNQFTDNAYCMRTRVLYVTKIDEHSCAKYVRALITMSQICDKTPIEIVVSSYGGSVYDGLALYDFIRTLPCEVHTKALGKVMSMGVIIFLAGDKRFSTDNTTFMTHSVSSGTSGKIQEQVNDVEEGKRINHILTNILASTTKRNHKFWDKQNQKDFYFNTEEARKMGLVNA